MNIDPLILKRAESWLKPPFDAATREEVHRLIESNSKTLSDAFFKDLSFGTGGMRALMGAGTNRLNVYTIRAATLGLAHAILQQPLPPEGHSVFIGYDVRKHSKEFALNAARVLAMKGIRALLTEEICPTPLVSFGCRFYRCSAAIMITASHNPPTYNGYKVYWNDGGQVVAPHDQEIIDEVHKIPIEAPIPLSPIDSPLITWVGRELDEAYLAALKDLQLAPPLPLKILYTPLHGTGIRIIPQALQSWGYSDLHFVEEQKHPDEQFTYAPLPNPEEKQALELGMKQLVQEQRDLLIATDPDADRIGVVVVEGKKPVLLTGNQTACLCLYHICTTLTARKEWPSNAALIKTIVTTELFRKIAEHFGGHCIDVLTGFKYIGEQITLWQNSFDAYQYLFGAEESCGFLFGTLVRDKDAINASCLIAEAAACAKKQNLTLLDRLYLLYQKFGIHRESLTNLTFEEGPTGMAQMTALMQELRKTPPTSIASIPVERLEDYLVGTAKDLSSGQSTQLTLPQSDALRFWLSDGSKLVIRPSGTEPKIKIYGEVVQKTVQNIDQDIQIADERLANLIKIFQKEIHQNI